MNGNGKVDLGACEAFLYAWHTKKEYVAPVRFIVSVGHGLKALIGYSIEAREVRNFLIDYQPTSAMGKSLRARLVTIEQTVNNQVNNQQNNQVNNVVRPTGKPNSSGVTRPSQPKPVSQPGSVSQPQRYSTHEGTSYDPSFPGTYQASDTADDRVSVKFYDRKKAISASFEFRHKRVTSDTNEIACRALTKSLGLSDSASFADIKHALDRQRSNNDNFPEMSVISDKVEDQLDTFALRNANKPHVCVVLNASQMNYKEQGWPGHDMRKDIRSVHGDNTFGPGVAKYHKGGVEFLAHCLEVPTQDSFSGAFSNFFKSAQPRAEKLQCDGGYYRSNMTANEWTDLTDKLKKSKTPVECFRWEATEGTEGRRPFRVYQTGAINSKNGSSTNNYARYHKKAGPSQELEFWILFLQFRNALLTELSALPANHKLSVHTTRIGEGVFSNTQGTSNLALVAALTSLPDGERRKIVDVSVGTYNDENPSSWASQELRNYKR